MITYYIKPLIVESIRELEFRKVFFHKLKPFGVLASMERVKEVKSLLTETTMSIDDKMSNGLSLSVNIHFEQ